jgi:hypothetical protein
VSRPTTIPISPKKNYGPDLVPREVVLSALRPDYKTNYESYWDSFNR